MATITFTGFRLAPVDDLNDQLVLAERPQSRHARVVARSQLATYAGDAVGAIVGSGYVATVTYGLVALTPAQFEHVWTLRSKLVLARDEDGHLDYGVLNEISGDQNDATLTGRIGNVRLVLLGTSHDAGSFVQP